MLTKEEKKLINYENLPEDLRLKIDAAFESPDLIVALSYASQIRAWSNEMILRPFTIREEVQLSVSDDGVKEALKEAITARQNTETSLKVLKELDELGETLKSIQQRLSPEQKDLTNKAVVTHKDLKGVAFGKTNS